VASAGTSTAVFPSNGLVPGNGVAPILRIATSQPRGTLLAEPARGAPLVTGVLAAISERCKYVDASLSLPSARYMRPTAASAAGSSGAVLSA
jgi:hypothetical protein